MYLVTVKAFEDIQVAVDHKNLPALTNLLENNRIKFEVNGVLGKHTPDQFGFGGYNYWE